MADDKYSISSLPNQSRRLGKDGGAAPLRTTSIYKKSWIKSRRRSHAHCGRADKNSRPHRFSSLQCQASPSKHPASHPFSPEGISMVRSVLVAGALEPSAPTQAAASSSAQHPPPRRPNDHLLGRRMAFQRCCLEHVSKVPGTVRNALTHSSHGPMSQSLSSYPLLP